jgi:hypothetical protein
LTVDIPLISFLVSLDINSFFPLNLVPMDKELSEHSFKVSDQEALEQLKVLMEFTSPKSLRKSLHTIFFAYLSEQADTGQDGNFKQVIQDYFFLFEFLDKLESK